MGIIVLSNHSAVFPSLHYFHAQNLLKAVISVDRAGSETIFQMQSFCASCGIGFFKISKPSFESALLALFNQLQPDMVIMCGFPFRIPKSVFSYPALGFYNVHFSLLPAYMGPDPVFWQLKNGEKIGGITIHRVDEQFDSGPIVLQQQIPFIPGENWGICNSRFGVITTNMLAELIKKIQERTLTEQLPINGKQANYNPRPTQQDLTIDWTTQTASQVEGLVNACNPHRGGAITAFKYQMIRIMEVSPVDGQGDPATAGGTIIHADVNGLFVQCADASILRINILVLLNEGTISGFKLAALGVSVGERFENYMLEEQAIN
jgi:methionyl-tRNA formyltransferase